MNSEYMAYLYLQGYTDSDNSNQYPVGEGDIDDSSSWQLIPVTPYNDEEGGGSRVARVEGRTWRVRPYRSTQGIIQIEGEVCIK